MSLSLAIVGLPNVGKSSLFNLLTKNKAEASNYPFCTIDPNVGVVTVPDIRLDALAKLSNSKKIIPTTIEFVDVAGLVKGAHKGEGLGNQFLASIRECDAICEVVRGFEDDNIIHVSGKVDPKEDKEVIALELVFADLNTVTKRLGKVARESKSGDKELISLRKVLEKLQKHLEEGGAVRDMDLDDKETELIKSLSFLTNKPIIYVLNTDDQDYDLGTNKANSIKINVKLEQEIMALDVQEQKEYLEELGLEKSGLDKLIATSYDLLGLDTFLTTGPEETRAWTIKKGATAPQAGAAIHTDFEKQFIRVEAINWEILVEAGSELNAKEKGLIRTEGKTYIVKDGDVCNFLVSK